LRGRVQRLFTLSEAKRAGSAYGSFASLRMTPGGWNLHGDDYGDDRVGGLPPAPHALGQGAGSGRRQSGRQQPDSLARAVSAPVASSSFVTAPRLP
jgi:hypothetical protein